MDVSLYKLAIGTERSPQPLLVNPATLLSLAESVIELLVEQQISATLWLKLPPGKVWLSPIGRYHEQVKVSHTTYLCHNYKAELIAPDVSFPLVPIQLASNSQLRRDYFLLVLSPQFSSLILAHRSRSRSQKKAKSRENTQRKKTLPLLSLCSFEGQTIQVVLEGLKHAIGQSTRMALVQKQSQTIPQELLQNWESLFIHPPAANSVLIEQLLAKQIQQQDAVRRSVISQRIATLQKQNQELISASVRKDESLNSMCEELRSPLTHMKAA